MIKTRTVFVLGAGASNTFGFPIGSALIDQLHEIFSCRIDRSSPEDNNPQAREYLLKSLKVIPGTNSNDLATAAKDICRSLPGFASVDLFMGTHFKKVELVRYARLAIALRILQCEALSIDLRPGEDKWPLKLWEQLRHGVLDDDASRMFDDEINAVRFVTFNYDRSLEAYLLKMFKNSFLRGDEEAAEAIRNAKILHVYGKIGALPHLAAEGEISCQYGGLTGLFPEPREEEFLLDKLAKGIRVYTERTENKQHLDAIGETMAWAQRVVMLGFGFLEDNVDLLRPARRASIEQIYATDKDGRKLPRQMNGGYLAKTFGLNKNNVHLWDENCQGLLDEIGQVLRRE